MATSELLDYSEQQLSFCCIVLVLCRGAGSTGGGGGSGSGSGSGGGGGGGGDDGALSLSRDACAACTDRPPPQFRLHSQQTNGNGNSKSKSAKVGVVVEGFSESPLPSPSSSPVQIRKQSSSVSKGGVATTTNNNNTKAPSADNSNPSTKGSSTNATRQAQLQLQLQREFRENARNTMVRFGLQRGLAEVINRRDTEACVLACAAVVALVGSSSDRADLVCHGTSLVEALLGLMESKGAVEKGDRRLLIEGVACLVALRSVILSSWSTRTGGDVSMGIRCKIVLRKSLHILDDLLASGHPAACGEGRGGDRERVARTRSLYARAMKMHHELSLVPDSGREGGGSCVVA
jgi:hypothetical protein